jgi:hypothetical protein
MMSKSRTPSTGRNAMMEKRVTTSHPVEKQATTTSLGKVDRGVTTRSTEAGRRPISFAKETKAPKEIVARRPTECGQACGGVPTRGAELESKRWQEKEIARLLPFNPPHEVKLPLGRGPYDGTILFPEEPQRPHWDEIGETKFPEPPVNPPTKTAEKPPAQTTDTPTPKKPPVRVMSDEEFFQTLPSTSCDVFFQSKPVYVVKTRSCMECHALQPWERAQIGLPYDQPWFTKDSAAAMETAGKGIVIAAAAATTAVVLPALVLGAPTEFMVALNTWPAGVTVVQTGLTVGGFFGGGTIASLPFLPPDQPGHPSKLDYFDAATTVLFPGPGTLKTTTFDPIPPAEWNDQLPPEGHDSKIRPSVLDEFEDMSNKKKGFAAETLDLSNGVRVTAQSGAKVFPELHPRVQEILFDHVLNGGEVPNAGGCGLPAALTEILDLGWDPKDAFLSTVILKGAHKGQEIAPCPGCEPLVEQFNLDYLGEIKSLPALKGDISAVGSK